MENINKFIVTDHWPPLVSFGRIILALGLGLLIGMERERAGKEIGVRTFAFTSLAGALTWMLSSFVGIVALIFIAALAVLINVQTLVTHRSLTITTSVCLFLTMLFGALVGRGHTFTPSAATLLLVAFLSYKEALVKFSLKLTQLEIRSALTLGIIAFVVYPLLPQGYIDSWQLINLQSAWLTVILISSIGFINYILLKLYGAKGIPYTGFLGGLVSSTATVTALAASMRSKEAGMRSQVIAGMRLANAAMFLRNSLILGILAPNAIMYIVSSMGIMLLVSLGLALIKSERTKQAPVATPDLGLDSPVSLRSALKYGVIFLVITVLGELSQRLLGTGGFYLVSFIGGLVSSASTSATAANLAIAGSISMPTAAFGTLLASVASSTIQVGIAARVSSDGKLTARLSRETGVILGTGVAIMLLQMWLQMLGILHLA